MYVLDAALLDYAVNRHEQTRQGNRHPSAAPHGAFPCKAGPPSDPRHGRKAGPPSDPRHGGQGDDAWVAISVFTDADWRALTAAMGEPAWAGDERFATLLGRKGHEDELERLVGGWTSTMTTDEAASLLRACGVPAAVVANSHDLHTDAQLVHRGHYINLNHPVIGDFPFDALSYRLNGVSPRPPRAAPLLGQDNSAVYCDLLGLEEDEYRALEADGVFK